MMTLFISSLVGLLVWTLSVSGGVKPMSSEKGAEVVLGESSNALSATNHQPDNDFILVDVSGAVEHPGVYQVKAGSRINDALKLSGGFVSSASAKWVSEHLNLASVLADSEKLYIPYEWDLMVANDDQHTLEQLHTLSLGIVDKGLVENSTGKSSAVSTALSVPKTSTSNSTESSNIESDATSGDVTDKVSINKASEVELDTLVGIGPAYAAKISATRPFSDFDDMAARSGVPKAVLDKIKLLVIFD